MIKRQSLLVLLAATLLLIGFTTPTCAQDTMPLLVILMEFTNDSYVHDNGTPNDTSDDYKVPGRHDDAPLGKEGLHTRDNGSLERNIIYGQIFGGDADLYPVYPRIINGTPSMPARVNGVRRCLNDYFKEISGGEFEFDETKSIVTEWITAWDDPLTHSHDESTAEYWLNLPDFGGGQRMWWFLKSLNKAYGDNFDFAQWDVNGDGHIMLGNRASGGELAVLAVHTFYGGGGCSRELRHQNYLSGPFVLNGITFAPTGQVALTDGECFEDFGQDGSVHGFQPFYIAAHELGHAVFNFKDTYNNVPEKVLFGLYGGNRGPFHPDPYQTHKAGWLNYLIPAVDSWYIIPDVETSNSAVLFLNESHGDDEFFIVENRYAGTSYDNESLNFNPPRVDSNPLKDYTLPDEGLFVWHIDTTPTSGQSKIQLIHRDGMPGSGPLSERSYYLDAAFSGDDPNEPGGLPFYYFHDYSTPANARWRNNGYSDFGIWKMSNAGQSMSVYLDVPGPGVFIETIGDSKRTIQAGTGGVRFVFQITNTWEIEADIDVEITGLSPQLTVTSDPAVRKTIPAKSSTQAHFDINFNDTTGGFQDTFAAKATQVLAPSVFDAANVEVNVCKDELKVPNVFSPPNTAVLDGDAVTLNWQSVSATVTHYDVELCSNSDCSTVLRSVEVDESEWLVAPALYDNTTYYWRVRANDDCSTTPWTEIRHFATTCAAAVPAVPTLREPANGADALAINTRLAWDEVADADAYLVVVSKASNINEVIRTFRVTQDTEAMACKGSPWMCFDITPDLESGDYQWMVRAENGCSNSNYSASRFFSTLDKPSLVYPSDNAIAVSKNPTFQWQPVDGAETYDFELSTSSDFVQHLAFPRTGATQYTYTATLLDSTTPYYWRVRARNGDLYNSFGPWCSARQFTTCGLPSIAQLPSPYPADGATDVSPSVTLSWGSIAGTPDMPLDITTYSVDISLYNACQQLAGGGYACSDGNRVAFLEDVGNQCNLSAYLQPDHDYWWKVTLHVTCGTMEFPANKFTTTECPLPETRPWPEAPQYGAEASVLPTLVWNYPFGGSTFGEKEVVVCSDPQCASAVTWAPGIGGNSWTVFYPLDTGTQYWWRVRHVNDCGGGPWSNISTFVTPNSADTDEDGIADQRDNCPYMPNPGQEDMDDDHVGDICDPDMDGDGVANATDNCLSTPNGALLGTCITGRVGALCYGQEECLDRCDIAMNQCLSACEPTNTSCISRCLGNSADCAAGCSEECGADGICNFAQEDADADNQGDACDDCPSGVDQDADGICDEFDNCPETPNGSELGTCTAGNEGAPCSSSAYNSCNRHCDGIQNNCLMHCSPMDKPCRDQCEADHETCVSACDDGCGPRGVCSQNQEDVDGDGTGDVCETCILGDRDADGICDEADNCPSIDNGPNAGTCLEGNIGAPCSQAAYDVCAEECIETAAKCLLACTPNDMFCRERCQSDYSLCITKACDYGCGPGNACSLNQEDADGDGRGDVCDGCPDDDLDGACNTNDNCPNTPNGSQRGTCTAGSNVGQPCDNGFFNGCVADCNDVYTQCQRICDPLNILCFDTCRNDFAACTTACEGGCGTNGVCSQAQEDVDGDGLGDACDTCSDRDHDGVCDDVDNCPRTANSDQSDADGDGVGDMCDACSDRDRDSICDVSDTCPVDAQNDADADGVCGNVDNCPTVANTNQTDSDSDGVGNTCDNCPFTSNADQLDGDKDGIGDLCDQCLDSDADTICDTIDNCIAVANTAQRDTDSDTVGDACDNCPTTQNPDQADRDKNGVGDVCSDTDSDGVMDQNDNCPVIANANQADRDSDGVGDVCDNCPTVENRYQIDRDKDGIGDICDTCTDDDGDRVCDNEDNCPNTYNPDQADWNGNGAGDACDLCRDQDRDGICDNDDNCLDVSNPDQLDKDRDDIGDACDACRLDLDNDRDRDGVCGNVDNCPLVVNPDQTDRDGDGLGDVCDPCPMGDRDNDGVCDSRDNCRAVTNPDQADTDNDGVGNACDPCHRDADNDLDRDGVCGDVDNCPENSNPDQTDTDDDGIGNACDICRNDPDNDIDGDGVCGDRDNCPAIVNPDQIDSDGDGYGDVCPISDMDGDGDVDGADLMLFSNFYDTSNRNADLNADNIIDEQDLIKFIEGYGTTSIE